MSALLAAEPTEVIVIDLYCRMSFGDDGTVFKCEDQEAQGRESVREWAEDQGLVFGVDVVIGEVEYDHALSAWQPKVIRPGFNRTMDRMEGGISQGVWVRDVDRFTRKMHEAVRIADVAKGGARVLGYRSDYDLTSRKGRKRFLEDAMDAEDESSRISERSRDGFVAKAKRGRSNSAHRGFARDGYLPKPVGWETGDPRERVSEVRLATEVTAVRDLAKGLLDGTTTLAATAREWNERGLLSVNGCRWDGAALRQLLTSPSLAGRVTYKGKPVVKDGEPVMLPGVPVLDGQTWDRLDLYLKSRKRGRPATAYVLSGVLRCGLCDSPLYGRPVVSQTPYPDGAVRRQYWCQYREKDAGGCGRLTIDHRWTDATVEDLVVAVLEDPKNAERISRAARGMEAAQAAARQELATLKAEKLAIAGKTGQPGWDLESVDAAMANYAPRIAEAQARLDALSDGDTATVPEDVRATWRAGTVTAKRSLVSRAFPRGLTVKAATSRGKASLDRNRLVPR